jgi:hypothetical protein
MPATLPQQEARHETGGTVNRRIQPERYAQVFLNIFCKILLTKRRRKYILVNTGGLKWKLI